MTLNAKQIKVAIVHDWLVIYGGAERVLEHIIDIYPNADIYSLIDFVSKDQRHFLRGKKPFTSFLQKIPGIKNHYRKMLPLMPIAIEQFDLSEYDIIISSHYSVAKGVLTGPNQTHICYCHSPMRYAWDHYHEYLREMNLERGIKSWFARWQLHRIRGWDIQSSNSVDYFIANSSFVAKRIEKYYRRLSQVIHPPVDTMLFKLEYSKENYYVCAGRFVPFKRIDLVAQAFSKMPDKRLILIGDGPEMAKIKKQAGPNCTFTGFLTPEEIKEHLGKAKAFIFPSEEDFGIVPVEAQACGTPIIAYGRGGALETVIPWTGASCPGVSPTGLFFNHQTAQSIVDAVQQFEKIETIFDPYYISKHAQSFSVASFKNKFHQAVSEKVNHLQGNPPTQC